MYKIPAFAVVLALAIAVPISLGSSHREAPLTALDPTGDVTDVYAFTAPDAQNKATLVANWIPFEDPAGGPNFYRFDDKARYYINVDNTGDGVADVKYLFRFKTEIRRPNSFLYALPGVSSVDDPKINIFQSYSVDRVTYKNGRLTGLQRLGTDLPAAPNNVGPKTIPDYATVAGQAVKGIAGGGKVFAGQRDDPFFVDLGSVFDAINFRPGTGTGAQGGGKDDVAGYGVHSIVLQVPEWQVTKNGKSVIDAAASNATIGVWASTERPKLSVLSTASSAKATVSKSKSRRGAAKRKRARRSGGLLSGDWVQVSRLGNPLVNEVVIPLGKKDLFNRTTPDEDAARYGQFVLNPELAATMNLLFPGVVNAPETNRTDIVTALLQGLPGLNRQVATNTPAVDTLKLNLGTPPSATPSRFGVIGGDNAGFPNGRRLDDDVVDIELRVVAGFLLGNKVPLGDGVDQNDKAFAGSFPYLAMPDSGFDSSLKRVEPLHAPTPGQP